MDDIVKQAAKRSKYIAYIEREFPNFDETRNGEV